MNYSKLRGAIREKFGTQKDFAAAIGMNPSTLNSKLANKSEWTRKEMEDACRLLTVPISNLHEYFFAK